MQIGNISAPQITQGVWTVNGRTLTATVGSIIEFRNILPTSLAIGLTLDLRGTGVNVGALTLYVATIASGSCQIGLYDGTTLSIGQSLIASQSIIEQFGTNTVYGLAIHNNSGVAALTYAVSGYYQI